MKVYKVELMILDFDQIGAEGIASELENARYANDCIGPRVTQVAAREVGQWDDAHPLNHKGWEAEFLCLFAKDES